MLLTQRVLHMCGFWEMVQPQKKLFCGCNDICIRSSRPFSWYIDAPNKSSQRCGCPCEINVGSRQVSQNHASAWQTCMNGDVTCHNHCLFCHLGLLISLLSSSLFRSSRASRLWQDGCNRANGPARHSWDPWPPRSHGPAREGRPLQPLRLLWGHANGAAVPTHEKHEGAFRLKLPLTLR